MFDAATVQLLESGCALIVGFVTADGKPHAGRGWGLTLFNRDRRARLIVNARDLTILGDSSGSTLVRTTIAVTGCNVLNLRSVQLKGLIESVDPVTPADQARMEQYCNGYFDDCAQVDAIPRILMEQLIPEAVAALEFRIEETFDQTPGPAAGAALTNDAP